MNLRHLGFGLLVLAAYWLTAQRGWVFFEDDQRAAPAAVHGSGPRFWGNGYQGGK